MIPTPILGLTLLLTPAPGDDLPRPYDSEPGDARPMPAAEAARSFRVPEEFRVEVFASEPEVRNPIGMAWDARGRLWVAENYTYAETRKKFDMALRDRVLVFEDADGDGRPERRTVFTDEVQRLTSVEPGPGGVWLMAPPQLLFVPDRDGDDRPDGPGEVVLDGFDVPAENYHNVANGLRWGPDGWLYGRCGASAPGEVAAPGTPKADRIPLRGGFWRYHPGRKRFEALAHGTTNPWGHDWDAEGEAFFINTVNGHLWHAVPGMHFVRPHTIDPNPRVYEMVDQHADHWHWDHSKDWSDSRKPTAEHDRAGGGHAHSGMLIYHGSQWPDAYRGRVLTINYHGRRLNVDRLDRERSGFVGRHEPDILFAADPFFRGVELGEGPDGSVYVLDWNDTGECHENTGVVRSSGRIYRVIHGDAGRVAPRDLAKLPADELAKLAIDGDEWHARRARLVVSGRTGDERTPAVATWHEALARKGTTVRRLRALWALNACGQLPMETPGRLLDDRDESLRVWAVRLVTDALPIDTALGRRPPGPDPGLSPVLLAKLVAMADSPTETPRIRLALASALQRLPIRDRLALGEALGRHEADATDHNLPLLVWYGLGPVADVDPSGLAKLVATTRLPATRRYIARRLVEDLDTNPGPVSDLVEIAGRAPSSDAADILAGLSEGLRGWRKATPPASWGRVGALLSASDDATVARVAKELSVLFGDGRALGEVKALALDEKADLDARRAALKTLIEARPADLRDTCERLLKVRFLNATAVRGLALFDDPAIGRSLAANYRAFHPSERGAVLDTLASRPGFASALLDAVEKGGIPKADISAFHARQIRSLADPSVSQRLVEVWGEVRETSEDKARKTAEWKARLTSDRLASADKSQGRLVFNKLCASCHTLYGQGGQVGPDLTGAGRDNLDYVLQNVIDPGAAVTADYRMLVVAMKDGRVLNGIVKARSDKTISLQTQAEVLDLARSEIEESRPSSESLMPEGQLDPLSEAEVRDLVAYLMHRSQVALPR